MDDYLAKPFRRDALRLVLERWALDQAPGNATNQAPGGELRLAASGRKSAH
jgi:hypothetical protein